MIMAVNLGTGIFLSFGFWYRHGLTTVKEIPYVPLEEFEPLYPLLEIQKFSGADSFPAKNMNLHLDQNQMITGLSPS